MADMIESTLEDLKKFEDAGRVWIDRLGLKDWDCIFKLEDLEDANARVCYRVISRKATFRLAKSRENFKPVEVHALHEALELLMADIAIGIGHLYSDDFVDNEIHRVINRLMAVLPCSQKIQEGNHAG